MNKVFFSLIFIAFIIGANAEKANAQCKQQVVYNCATNNGKAIYLRDFNTKLRKAKGDAKSGSKYAVVLNKGTHYRFNLCTQSGYEKSVVLTLFDGRNPEEKPYAKTESTSDPKTNNRFDFICQKSGTYYVSIRIKEGASVKKTCAVGILSFVGKSKR